MSERAERVSPYVSAQVSEESRGALLTSEASLDARSRTMSELTSGESLDERSRTI